jgi:hypothetical protein
MPQLVMVKLRLYSLTLFGSVGYRGSVAVSEFGISGDEELGLARDGLDKLRTRMQHAIDKGPLPSL